MAPKTLDDDRLADALFGVFRDLGYDGASLARIAAATGLGRSSLYHRFPGGKEEMAERVARDVGVRFGARVLAPAAGAAPLGERIRAIVAELDRFYDHGRRRCILDTLTIGAAGPATAECLRAAATAWIEVFAALAREAGLAPDHAACRAEDAVAAIEGALVVARATGRLEPFRRALESLEHRLTDAVPE